MKRISGLIIMLAMLAGCGSPQGENQTSGVMARKDYVAEGMKFLSQSDIVNAVKSFDSAIKQEPQNINNYLTLGEVYLRLKQPQRAIDTLSAGLRVSPDNGHVLYMLAVAYGAQGDQAAAEAHAKKSAEVFLKEKDQEMFQRSIMLVQSLTGAPEAAAPTPPVVN